MLGHSNKALYRYKYQFLNQNYQVGLSDATLESDKPQKKIREWRKSENKRTLELISQVDFKFHV